MLDAIYATRPDTPFPALTYRLKYVKARLAALDKALKAAPEGTERVRWLDAERRALLSTRRELEEALNPPKVQPDPAQRARQKRLLDSELRERTSNTLGQAARCEREGDWSSALRHRLSLVTVGDLIIREYAIPVELLADATLPRVDEASV